MYLRRRGDGASGRESGQVLVLFALMSTVMLLMAAVAVDVSRFVSERRFLQNAADASALAGAQVLSGGGTAAEAEAAARQVIGTNIAGEPTGNAASQPSATPIYEGGSAPTNLVEGILIDGKQIRVALRNDVNFAFGAVVGLADQTIMAGALAGPSPEGGVLPIAVRQFLNPVDGPFIASPCPGDAVDVGDTQFRAIFATAATSCTGTTTNATGRADPTVGDPGPTVEILGSDADANEGTSFRGFVALDIRNFENDFSREYYNGVTDSTAPNVLKDMQAGWITNGYPGPPFPPVVSPPDPRLQIATMDGNSAGIAVTAFEKRFAVGDLVMVLVYNGTVNQIPEFSMDWPNNNRIGRLDVPVTGTGQATFQISRNQAFTGGVDITTLADPNDPLNPLNVVGQMGPITYSPNPVYPDLGGGTTVTIDATTVAAVPGVYAMWAVGQSTQYGQHVKYLPVSLNVGGVTADFTLGSPQALGPDVPGGSVTFSVPVDNASKGSPFGGTVDLKLERIDGTVVSTIATGVSTGQSVNVVIDTSGLSNGAHTYVVRGTGLNADGVPVAHLLPLTVYVGSESPGDNSYVDITGFAVMEVMYVDPNEVRARALTPVVTDMNDEALQLGRPPRLLPWDYTAP